MDFTTDPSEIVVLTSVDTPPRRQTKTLQVDDGGWESIGGADNAYEHSADAYPFGTLDDIYLTLEEIAELESSFAIPGDIIPGTVAPLRRLSSITHGDDRTIQTAPRIWLPADIDSGVEAPANWLDDSEALAQEVIETTLPEAFHEAGVVVKWSNSMLPGACTAKAHFFFILDTALYIEQVKQWLSDCEHVDPAILKPGQPIYTADPLVVDADGCVLADPLADDRRLILDGPPVSVPLSVSAAKVDTSGRLPDVDDGHDADDVWLPAVPEDEMLIRLDYGLQRCGRDNWRIPPGQMKGLHRAMRDVQFRYLIETYGRPRDKEWLRSQIEKAIREHSPDEPEDYIQLIVGRKFDEAWRDGLPKARVKALAQRQAPEPEGEVIEAEAPEVYVLSDAEKARLIHNIDGLPALALSYERRGDVAKAEALRDLWRSGE